MKQNQQNKRNTKQAKRSLMAKRNTQAVDRASVRWDGVAKILGVVSRGAAVNKSVNGVNWTVQQYSL